MIRTNERLATVVISEKNLYARACHNITIILEAKLDPVVALDFKLQIQKHS